MLIVITMTVPPTNTDLTTLEYVQQVIGGINSLDQPDISRLIKDASAAVISECLGRVFPRATYSETLPGYGFRTLMLSRRPIVSVTSVTHNNSPIIDYTIEDAAAGFLYRKLGWQWTAGVGWNIDDYILPNSEDPQFTVVYQAGYTVPADGANFTLPGDIHEAVLETIKVWRKTKDRDYSLVRSGNNEYFSSRDTVGLNNLPPRALSLLSKWVSGT